MNALAQPVGLALIAMALAAGGVVATRSRSDPRWGWLAIAVLVAILTALAGLVAYSAFPSPYD